MVVSVNGEIIEEALIKEEFERLKPEYVKTFAEQTQEEQNEQLWQWSRENLIERVLLRQEAQKRPDIPKAKMDEAFDAMKKRFEGQKDFEKELSEGGAEKIREQLALQMKLNELVEEISGNVPEPSQQAVEELYGQVKGRFKKPERIRVSHVVKHINGFADGQTALDKIREAQGELKSGALFEEVVARYSDCKDNSGDLGYIERGLMVEEFEDVAFNLGVKEVSDIFQSRYGYHIVKLYDRQPESTAPIEEVRESLVEQLKEQAKKDMVDDFLDELKKIAKIVGV